MAQSLSSRPGILMRYFKAMSAHFGPSHWWPGESALEIAVGAILTQNTNWGNVEKALARLRQRDALRLDALWEMPVPELEECLRPSGFFRLKAQRLRAFLTYLTSFDGWDENPASGSLDFLGDIETGELRSQLLAIKGIGPETADSILLYALERPSFVVDAYTRRIFSRHALVDDTIAYEHLRSFFTDGLEVNRSLYNEYHALIVRTAKEFCRKTYPRCAVCPLGPFLETPRA